MKRKCMGLAVLALCLFFGPTGMAAQIINVTNPSFELDLAGQPNETKRDLSEVLGWVEGLDNGSGVETIINYQNPPNSFTGTGDGAMKAYGVWDGEGTATGDWWYQILSHQIVAGEEYQLTFAYGVNSAYTPIIASFIDGSTMEELASVTVNTGTKFVFVDYVLNMTVPADAAYAGHNLGVKFRIGQKTQNAQYDGWASVDNVRVTMGHNETPQVSAGQDMSINLPVNSVSLDGTVSDDGEPNPPAVLSVTWQKVTGPESYTITDPHAVDTTVTFSSSGYYVFRLTAGDTLLTASDDVTVTVYMPGGVMTNEGDYPNNQVPKYRKFEATLNVQTVAQNYQMPYDASPPAGLAPGIGVSLDVLFSPDNWVTTYTQPAFYYKDMEYKAIGNSDWWYPTGKYFWKVRFSPNCAGTWKYKYILRDSSGTTESSEMQFVACESDKKGFIKVSDTDIRYFEHDNGDLFVGLGHNLRFRQLSWDNPIIANRNLFQKLNDNGTQLFRTWLSHWCIWGSYWNPWNSPLVDLHSDDPPFTGQSIWEADPNSEVCLRLSWPSSPAMFAGWSTGRPTPIKRDTNYRFSIRYFSPFFIEGPRIAGYPYGVVLKLASTWLDDEYNSNVYSYCDPDELRTDGKTTTIVTDYGTQSGQWTTVQGTWNSGSRDFLPLMYLVLENVIQVINGMSVDKVEICEDYGNGQYGPCILGKDSWAQHYYMDQHKSWEFDKVIELAEEYDIYLKLVLMEKQDWILTRITPAGYISDVDNPDNFYGQYRTVDKGRWLQMAWWRYCQARWGYSPNIHSWETTNEANPGSYRHYTQVDEMGKYFHQFGNKHLCTTSFWTTFPTVFWASSSYPDVDYADLHKYELGLLDCAANTVAVSLNRGAYQPGGAGKPVIRGETGFFEEGTARDSEGIWLHNLVWGTINHGGMYELYWDNIDEFSSTPDPRRHYRPMRNFIEDVPLNNGNYADAAPTVTGANLRSWGQKDTSRGYAHLWIQNDDHLWKNVRDGVTINPASGTVDVSGFVAGRRYEVQWWDTYQSDKSLQITSRQVVVADGTGKITLTISNLTTDVAVKTGPAADLDDDGSVDSGDLALLAGQWLWTGTAGSVSEDIIADGAVNFVDYAEFAGVYPQ